MPSEPEPAQLREAFVTESFAAIDGRWPQLATSFEARTILVVGDLMLDHTAAGQAWRLSPEAPVPVLTVEEEWYGLGGAANVARNLASLGARVRLAGVVGPDENGERLLDLCQAASINTDAIVVGDQRRTTVKTRFIAGTQQVLRVDSETAEPLDFAMQRQLIARLEGGRADAIIISDYAKGAVTDAVIRAPIEFAHRRNLPCVVDPKSTRFERYAGCTVITPNADEASASRGHPIRNDAESEAAGRTLLSAVGCEAAVITRGRQGVSLVTPADAWHLPAQARDVFDVAGAGDTLVAAFTLALASGASLLAAVALGNVAAGLVVQTRGVAATTREELARALAAWERSSPDLSREQTPA